MIDPIQPQPKLDHQTDQPLLASYLSNHDAPCPLCGYNLRNLQTNRCPECGRFLRLTVGLTEPALGKWLATLVALLLPGAFGLAVIVFFLIAVANTPIDLSDFSQMPLSIAFVLLHILSCVPLSIALLARRRWFLKLTKAAQEGSLYSSWGTIAVSIICLIYMAKL